MSYTVSLLPLYNVVITEHRPQTMNAYVTQVYRLVVGISDDDLK